MEQLAHLTGGAYYHDSRDMLKQLQGALADGREYYMLAYAPKNGKRDGRYRTITVETAGKKLNVRAKPGYWAPGEAQ
jgi:VWFA-related protein